jgi:hypothetical protein
LFIVTTFIGHSHVLTLLPILAPLPSGTFGECTCLTVCALASATGALLVELCKEELLPSHIHLEYCRWDNRSCHGCPMQDSHMYDIVSHR